MSQSGPLLLPWLLLLWPLGRSAASEFMNSSEAIKSSCVEDLNRFFGRTAIEDAAPEMMEMGLCWMDRDRIRSVVARPFILFTVPAFDALAIDSFVSFNSLMSGNELVES